MVRDLGVGIWQTGSLIGLHGGQDLLFAAPGHFQYGTHAQGPVVGNPCGGQVPLAADSYFGLMPYGETIRAFAVGEWSRWDVTATRTEDGDGNVPTSPYL